MTRTAHSAVRLFCSLCVAGVPSCGTSPAGPRPAEDATTRVLFIGSSLTYSQDIPAIFAALAAAAGHGPVSVDGVLYGNTDLRDHWGIGDAQNAIASRPWSLVVLEQGPSARADSRALLREYVARFDGVIKQAGAKTALFMTWPMQVNIADFPASSESYRLAAADVSATLFAVGDAWRAAWRMDQGLELYEDDFHPTVAAGYLAALVMVGCYYRESVVGLPSQINAAGRAVNINASLAGQLQRAADASNAACVGPSPSRAAERNGAARDHPTIADVER